MTALFGTAVSAVLVAFSVGTHYLAYRLQVATPGSPPLSALRWVDVNAERNIPTAWSVLLLLSAAWLAATCARGTASGRGWLLVAVTAGWLAADEGLELHERLGPAGRAVAGNALHFAWVVPATCAAAVVGVILLARLRQQPRLVRRRLIAAGAVFLTGAIALETASGLVLQAYGPREGYIVVTAAEEWLEMTGACLLLATLVAVRAARSGSGRTAPKQPAFSVDALVTAHDESGARSTGPSSRTASAAPSALPGARPGT